MTSKTNPVTEPGGDVARAVERLRAGEPVVVPTETVYGVACDARSEAAVRRVFALKGRPDANPLPVLVADAHAARRLVRHWPPPAQRLADAFWPGPLTIVLPSAGGLAPSVLAGRDDVALRCPDHPVARALAMAFDGPLALTSANRSGQAPATDAAQALAFLAAAGAPHVLTLNAGPSAVGQPSTIVRIAGARDEVEILRPGAISDEAILAALQ